MNKELVWQMIEGGQQNAAAWGKIPPELFTFDSRWGENGQGGADHD